MPSSESRNSIIESRRRTRRSPIPHRANATPSTGKQRVIDPKKPTQYVRGMSRRERVDMVLYELNEKHRWSIKDPVYHLVNEEPTKKYGMMCLARAKALSDEYTSEMKR